MGKPLVRERIAVVVAMVARLDGFWPDARIPVVAVSAEKTHGYAARHLAVAVPVEVRVGAWNITPRPDRAPKRHERGDHERTHNAEPAPPSSHSPTHTGRGVRERGQTADGAVSRAAHRVLGFPGPSSHPASYRREGSQHETALVPGAKPLPVHGYPAAAW